MDFDIIESVNLFGIFRKSPFFHYFYPNKTSTSVSDGTAILKRLKKDQDAGPMLYPHILLTKKLKEISMGHN